MQPQHKNSMGPPSATTVPEPDPTERTLDQLQREISTAREIVESSSRGTREVLEERLTGIYKAFDHLQQLHEAKFASIEAMMGIQFSGVTNQFAERDKRREQFALADKTAIASALLTQKESAIATSDSILAVIAKMEANFTKLIDQTQSFLQVATKNTDDKINDLKSRLDKGEGRSSIADPSTSDAMKRLGFAMDELKIANGMSTGHTKGIGDSWGVLLGASGALMAFVTLIILLLK